MLKAADGISYKRAREVLGVSVIADADEVRRAYHAAAKQAHPDRPGGDAEAFREVVEAYERLRNRPAFDRFFQPPAPPAPVPKPGVLTISPQVAMAGGGVEHSAWDGRTLRITLPPGLRTGDMIRADGVEITIAVRREAGVIVRGDDLWLSVQVDPMLLAQGGRIAVDTPLGRRIVWITSKAGARGLVRLPGQGLPARGRRRLGHMFLRLTPADKPAESPARELLRQFAAAWAA